MTIKVVQKASVFNNGSNNVPIFPKAITKGNFLVFFVQGPQNSSPPMPKAIDGYGPLGTGNNTSLAVFGGKIAAGGSPVAPNLEGLSLAALELSGVTSGVTFNPIVNGTGEFTSFTMDIPSGTPATNMVVLYAGASNIFDEGSVAATAMTELLSVYGASPSNPYAPGYAIFEETNVAVGYKNVTLTCTGDPGQQWDCGVGSDYLAYDSTWLLIT